MLSVVYGDSGSRLAVASGLRQDKLVTGTWPIGFIRGEPGWVIGNSPNLRPHQYAYASSGGVDNVRPIKASTCILLNAATVYIVRLLGPSVVYAVIGPG